MRYTPLSNRAVKCQTDGHPRQGALSMPTPRLIDHGTPRTFTPFLSVLGFPAPWDNPTSRICRGSPHGDPFRRSIVGWERPSKATTSGFG